MRTHVASGGSIHLYNSLPVCVLLIINNHFRKRQINFFIWKLCFYSTYTRLNFVFYNAIHRNWISRNFCRFISLLQKFHLFLISLNVSLFISYWPLHFYHIAEPEKVLKVKELYKSLDLPTAYAAYKEESYNTIKTHIQQMSCSVPHEIFLNILNEMCKRNA